MHKKINKKLLATGGLVTSLVLLSTANTSLAATTSAPAGIHRSFKAMSDAQIGKIAKETGLTTDEVRQELEDGKLLPEILKENGIDISQLREKTGGDPTQKALNRKAQKAFGNDPQFAEAEAKALNMSVDTLKADLSSQKLFQIVRAQGLTEADFRSNLAETLQNMINEGTISGDKATQYNHFIQKIQSMEK